jgi:hypothetical protein
MAGAVVAWLIEQTPTDLETVAAANHDVSGLILRQYRAWLPIVRVWARPHLIAIRDADGTTWERLLDIALARAPAQAAVCWRYKPWFFRQLDLVRQEVVRTWGAS